MPSRSLLQAFRSLRRRPAFALAAILTIALGVGANIAVFHIVYPVLLEPLPFRQPDRLVQIWESTPALPQLQVTVPDFEDWKRSAKSFDGLAAYTLQAMNKITLLGQGEPEVLQGTMATENLLPILGVRPLLGRWFSPEDQHEKRRVTLLSEALWRRKFAADPGIVGKNIRLEKESFTVIGILRRGEAIPEWADLWIPFSLIEPELRNTRKYHPLEIVGQLRTGVSADQAQAEIQTISRGLSQAYPVTNKTVGSYLVTLAGKITGDIRPSLLMVWAAVGMVLLIACANLAHLMLARLEDRRIEMAIRASLGANRRQLAAQSVAESLLLALSGGALGALLAFSANALFRRMAADQIPRMDWNSVAGPVWLFALAVSMVCALLFVLPAYWQAGRTETGLAGTRGGRRTVAAGKSHFGSLLMAGEIALAFLVLSGTVLLARSFAQLLKESPGIENKGILTAQIPLSRGWKDSAQLWRTRLFPALRALPGVQDVAVTNAIPLAIGRTEHSRFASRFGVEGETYESGKFPVAQMRWVTPDYFRVLRIPLKSGRWLTEKDGDTPVSLINESLARKFFPGQDPTRRKLILGVVDPHQEKIQIAGVVGDVREFGLDEEAPPTIYSITVAPSSSLLLKALGNPLAFESAVRQAVHGVDPEIAVSKIRPLSDYVAESLAHRRFALILIAVFAGLGAMLTAVGIYGVLAYSVSRRTRELGIRAAVGASPGKLLRMIFRETLAFTIPGLLAGFALSLTFSRAMKAMVYQVSPQDPLTLAACAVFVAGICGLTAWLPAREAARADPASALRQE